MAQGLLGRSGLSPIANIPGFLGPGIFNRGGFSLCQMQPHLVIFVVRPAWAHTCGCKSCCELVTVSKVKRNCMRVTECGEEAWSVNREPMNKNRIEGAAEQGEWAIYHEALVTKAWAA